MHYEINYQALDGDLIAKHNKAIADIKEYMGEAKFEEITKAFKTEFVEPLTLEQFGMYVSLAGISGYPVTAWYNYIWPL